MSAKPKKVGTVFYRSLFDITGRFMGEREDIWSKEDEKAFKEWEAAKAAFSRLDPSRVPSTGRAFSAAARASSTTATRASARRARSVRALVVLLAFLSGAAVATAALHATAWGQLPFGQRLSAKAVAA